MHSFIAATAAVAIALPAAAAEPNLQLQISLAGTSISTVGTGLLGVLGVPSAGIALGFERGADVYLLGFGGSWGRSDQAIITGVRSDGTVTTQSLVSQSWFAELSPGYRRYLGNFESGFAPFLEGHVNFGIARNHFGSLGPSSNEAVTSLQFGISGAFGGEVRVHRNFALTGQVIATASGSHQDGVQGGDAQGFNLGSNAGVTFRF
jgi:hypothetical protein